MLTRRLVAVLAIACGCTFAQSQEPAPSAWKSGEKPQGQTTKSQQYSATDQQGTDPLVTRIPATETKKKSNREEREREEKTTNERWLTYSTIWLAAVTTILAIFTGYLWGATRKLVIGAEQTAEKQLRAYVHLSANFNLDQCEIGKLIKISFPIRNYGQTPAHDMILRGWVGIQPYPAQSGWHIVPSGQEIKSVTVCAPGDQNIRGNGISETVLSKEMFNEILSGTEWRLYAWALITYRDVFGKKIRTTEARASTGGPDFAAARNTAYAASNGQPTIATIDWEYSKEQNRAD